MEPSTLGSSISTESALDLFNCVRWSTSPPLTLIDGFDSLLHGSSTPLRRGDVTEIQGVTASGKTQFLLKLAVNHLLPRSIHVRIDREVLWVPVGGKEEMVAWCNCTASATRFELEIDKLAKVLRFHLVTAITSYRRPKGIGAPTEEEVESLVKECLARLQVFSPTSTLQLACTIRTLPDWYATNATNGGSHEELGCVIVDGMTEFAWTDEYERSRTQSNSPRTSPLVLFSSAISHLRQTLAPLVFISQWVLRPSQPHAVPSQQDLPFYRAHFSPPQYPSLTNPPRPEAADTESTSPLAPLCYPTSTGTSYQVFPINYHITLHPSPRPTFRKGISLATVLAEGTSRQRGHIGEKSGANGSTRRDHAEAGEGWTERIVCVLREKGGREVGSWEMAIGANEIIA